MKQERARDLKEAKALLEGLGVAGIYRPVQTLTR